MPRGMLLPEAEIQDQADTLDLYINNNFEHYKRKIAMFRNLWLKYRKGSFDPVKASKLFSYLTADAAREYNRIYATPEYGEDAITLQARKVEDRDLVKEFVNAAKNHEYDFMIVKK